MRIEKVNAETARAYLPQLTALMIQTVDSGASIGWLPPMPPTDAEAYWQGRIAEVAEGTRVLFLALDGEALMGTAQLGLEQRPNGLHRAEVQKVMVDLRFRRRGVAERLMMALEDCAREMGRSLLFLDTREGDAAELLYRKVGYKQTGIIPNYVTNGDGQFEATVLYYKILA